MDSITYFSDNNFSPEKYSSWWKRERLKQPINKITHILKQKLAANSQFPNGLLVDLGAGTGDASLYLAKEFGFTECYATDGSHKMLSFLKENFSNSAIRITTQQMDLETDRLLLPDTVADIAIASGVTNYIKNIENLLAEASRTLKPGGFLGFDSLTHQAYDPTTIEHLTDAGVILYIYSRKTLASMTERLGLSFVCCAEQKSGLSGPYPQMNIKDDNLLFQKK